MPGAVLRLERIDEIATIHFERPPANAIDIDFLRSLETLVQELEARPQPGALVLTGSGTCFSAGLDLKVVPQYGPSEQEALVTTLNRTIYNLYRFPRPVVAAINGHAIAGGLILALACDYRVAPRGDWQFGLTEVKVGIPFPIGPMSVVRAELTAGVARRMVLGGDTMGPEGALASGVVDELQAQDRVLPRAFEVARGLASMPTTAFARIKRQLRSEIMAPLDDAVAKDRDPILGAWFDPTVLSAVKAMMGWGSKSDVNC